MGSKAGELARAHRGRAFCSRRGIYSQTFDRNGMAHAGATDRFGDRFRNEFGRRWFRVHEIGLPFAGLLRFGSARRICDLLLRARVDLIRNDFNLGSIKNFDDRLGVSRDSYGGREWFRRQSKLRTHRAGLVCALFDFFRSR